MDEKEKFKKVLKEKFYNTIRGYYPDFEVIVNLEGVTPAKFGERVKAVRDRRLLTCEQFAVRLSCSKQYVSQIETATNVKQVKIDKLRIITKSFGVSYAYMLGLTDKEEIEYDLAQYYFMEFPNSEFNLIKDEIPKKTYIIPMEFDGLPPDELHKKVTRQLKGDYELLTILDTLLNLSGPKYNIGRALLHNIGKLLDLGI